MANHWRAAAVLLCAVLSADGFYLPGVAPTEYAAGDAVEIKVRWFLHLTLLVVGNFQLS